MFLLVLILAGARILSAADDPMRELLQLMRNGENLAALQRVSDVIASADFRHRSAQERTLLLSARGRLLYQAGNAQQAEQSFWKMLEVCEEERLGLPCTLAAINSLLALYLECGQGDKAERLLKGASRRDLSSLPPDHPELLRLTANQCALAIDQKHLPEAEAACRRALDGWDSRQDRGSMDVAGVRNNLGLILLRRHKNAEAAAMLNTAVELMEQQPVGRARLAIPLANLASAHDELGDHVRADTLFRESLRRAEAELGVTHPTTAEVMLRFSDYLARHKQRPEAKRLREQAQRILETQTAEYGFRHTLDARSLR